MIFILTSFVFSKKQEIILKFNSQFLSKFSLEIPFMIKQLRFLLVSYAKITVNSF